MSSLSVAVMPHARADATDPFKGALGRIPNHSVRSPRPLLQLEGFLDQKALARRNRDESRAAAQHQQQQPPYEAPPSEAAWTNHAVLLRIEQAFGFTLDLEDIDLLITNSAIEPQAGYTPPPHTHTHTQLTVCVVCRVCVCS
jgi:hypothetical protein